MPSKLRFILLVVLAVVTFVVDRVLKFLALSGATFGPADGGIRFELFPNPAIAFSIAFPSWLGLVLTPIIIMVFVYVAVKSARRMAWGKVGAIALVVLPAVSNYLDRLRYGFVVDYVSVGQWLPVFNLSDVVIVCGLVLLAVVGERKI